MNNTTDFVFLLQSW